MTSFGKFRLYKTCWFCGTPVIWNEFRLNSGRPYTAYRLGPLLVHIYDK